MSQADSLTGKPRELFLLAMRRRSADMETRSYEQGLLTEMIARWEQPDRNPLTIAQIEADFKAHELANTHFPKDPIAHVRTIVGESFPRHAIAAAAQDMEAKGGGRGGFGGGGRG